MCEASFIVTVFNSDVVLQNVLGLEKITAFSSSEIFQVLRLFCHFGVEAKTDLFNLIKNTIALILKIFIV